MQQPIRCHYEVLEVDRRATTEEIRRAYKQLALRYHPDKNHGQVEYAERMFKEVQGSYSVLIDESERAWYDAHREAILRGDSEGTSAPDEVNLFNYFSSRCYDAFNDADGGFYAVYRNVFDLLVEEEAEYDKHARDWPRFGTSASPWEDVNAFYTHWTNFNSFKTFAWKDEYKLSEIPDRPSRRMAERINQKERAAAKKEYVTTVVQLAGFVRRRDPRVKEHDEKEAEEQRVRAEERSRRDMEDAKRRRAANERIWAEAAEREIREEEEREARGDAMDGTTLDILYEQQRMVEEARKTGEVSEFGMLTAEGADGDTSGGAAGKRAFNCPACKKTLGGEKQYAEHIKSTKHKNKLKQLAQKGVDVDALMGGGDGDVKESVDGGADAGGNPDDDGDGDGDAGETNVVSAASEPTKGDEGGEKTIKETAVRTGAKAADNSNNNNNAAIPNAGKGKKKNDKKNKKKNARRAASEDDHENDDRGDDNDEEAEKQVDAKEAHESVQPEEEGEEDDHDNSTQKGKNKKKQKQKKDATAPPPPPPPPPPQDEEENEGSESDESEEDFFASKGGAFAAFTGKRGKKRR